MSARPSESSYYELLEVGASATFEEIESSYQRIIAYLDTSSLAVYSMVEEDDISQMRAAVDEAYRTLSDPQRRSEYDRTLDAPSSGYPSLIVPDERSDSSVSVGRVASEGTQARADPPAAPEPNAFSFLSRPQPPPPPQTSAAPRPVETSPPPHAPVQPSTRSASVPVRSSQKRLKPTLEIELTDDTEFSGALLRRLRESANATLQDVADITKISKRYLRALEDNDYSALPAAVYVRGFVTEYARALGLDSKRVAKSYMSLYKRYREEGA